VLSETTIGYTASICINDCRDIATSV